MRQSSSPFGLLSNGEKLLPNVDDGLDVAKCFSPACMTLLPRLYVSIGSGSSDILGYSQHSDRKIERNYARETNCVCGRAGFSGLAIK